MKRKTKSGKTSSVKRRAQKVSSSTVTRLSKYYRTLNDLMQQGIEHISSEELAKIEGFTSAQVRKDLSFFGSFGRRGLGYNTSELRNRIATIMGLNRSWNVAIVGAGNIGSALVDYAEFRAHGFNIRALFDNDNTKVGTTVKSLIVQPVDALEEGLKRDRIDIVILAIPASAAQAMADRLALTSVRGILNFAPKRLHVPSAMVVRQENTAMELEALSYFILNQKRRPEDAVS